MAQTLCIKCGSELKPSSYCELCKQPLIFACTSCDYITEEKIHSDCRNAKELTKTMGGEAATSTQTPTTSTIRNQERSIIDKPIEHEVTVKGEVQSASPHLAGEENNNKDPFLSDTTQQFWQSLIANWYNAYGEFFKVANMMTEHWYNTYWKPWLDWQRQMQQKDRDKVEVE